MFDIAYAIATSLPILFIRVTYGKNVWHISNKSFCPLGDHHLIVESWSSVHVVVL